MVTLLAALSAAPPIATLCLLTGGGYMGRSSLAVSKPPTPSPSLLRTSFLNFPSAPLSSPPSSYDSRLWQKKLGLQQRSFNGVRIPTPVLGEKRSMILHASSIDSEGIDGNVPNTTPPEGSEVTVSVENLPLESKERLKLEQKLRMKLAKKIRLRRKRLVRKRRMRKKGRWPPSKMKKNKNV